jgi:hypothetical protein
MGRSFCSGDHEVQPVHLDGLATIKLQEAEFTRLSDDQIETWLSSSAAQMRRRRSSIFKLIGAPRIDLPGQRRGNLLCCVFRMTFSDAGLR